MTFIEKTKLKQKNNFWLFLAIFLRWTQHDTNTKLEKRIDDIDEWTKSLERCLKETDAEINQLQTEKIRTEQALDAKKVSPPPTFFYLYSTIGYTLITRGKFLCILICLSILNLLKHKISCT